MKKYQILNGNELIVQGALEAGFSLYTGYPGSPLADYFNILYKKRDELEKWGVKVAIANSEANGAAMASGAKQAGRDCLVAMKSMGLHVASDALSVGNFANPGERTKDPDTGEELSPGVVVVVGDDPWSISTSTPADSRYLFKHLHIPFLEPSGPQELKDWMKVALSISRRTSVYQGVLLTTFMAEGGGRVEVGEWASVEREMTHLDPDKFDLSKNVMVPPNSLGADREMINKRFPKVKKVLKELALDQTFGTDGSEVGVISSGVIFETLKQVMEEGDYLASVGLYKVACSYPLVDDFLVPWLKKLKTLIVVEEKRGFLESQVVELCQRHGIQLEILGKSFREETGFPAHGGLNFEIIRDKLSQAFDLLGLNSCSELVVQSDSWAASEALPRRLPTFCPGCPHRETLSLLKDLRKTLKSEGVNLLSHGDVGCYSLSFLPPFKEMHNLSAMGQGGALGAGVDLFSSNPSVVLMGDSTFFHSGMTDISNSLQCGHDITYILLDNDNTAMTGHQMTPRSGVSVDGHTRPRQDMVNLAKSLGVKDVTEVQPSDRYFYRNLLVDYVKRSGVKVIVSNKECALTFHGRQKARERKDFAQGKTQKLKSFYQINTENCEDCRVCVDLTGCPGLGQTFDAYGTKVTIDPQICVADSYCTKMKACPSFERVDVFNYHPTKYQKQNQLDQMTHENLPDPVREISFDDISQGRDLRIVVTGVGGSGVTTISKVLSKAAQEMGGRDDLDFKFMDQKGLAQRNGNVTGHLSFYRKGLSRGAVTPNGTADLLLSPDLLDGSQHIGFLSRDGLCILDDHFQIPVTMMLDRGELSPPLTEEELIKRLQNKLTERLELVALKDLCQKVLGRTVYASAMILGVAYQKGKLPFELQDMKTSFEQSLPTAEFENNWRAFGLGREWVVRGAEFMREHYHVDIDKGREQERELALLRESLRQNLPFWHHRKAVLNFYDRDFQMLCRYFPELPKKHLARYIHDIYVYDRGEKSDSFMQDASFIKDFYTDQTEREMALRILAKTYFIKDEVFVAHSMISPMQKKRDRLAYAHLGSGFKKIRINRPSFNFLGKKIEFDISPKTWMLKIMRHMRLLRLLMPSWHRNEKKIATRIREELLGPISKIPAGERYQKLAALDNIKGFREVRYEVASKVFNENFTNSNIKNDRAKKTQGALS